jgi:hypothetical protein
MDKMIVLYTGRRGAGKTLTMVKDGYKYKLSGYKIYSNIELDFTEYMENEQILDIQKTEIRDAILIIDEIQLLLDSRRSARKGNLDFSYFIQQIRKRNIIILCTTQFSGTVDLRLRQHVDIVARPKYDKDLHVCEVSYIDMTALNDNMFMNDTDFTIPAITIVYDAENIFPLYDTNRIQKMKEKVKINKKGVV